MKVHSTNYKNTFIEVAEDCPVSEAEIPPVKPDAPSVAAIQFEILSRNPYKYTSDDVLFQVYALRHNIPKSGQKEARAEFFSKGQPCFRTSPLTKRYGWGIHNNEQEQIALCASGTPEYKKFLKDKNLQVVKAMKSKR